MLRLLRLLPVCIATMMLVVAPSPARAAAKGSPEGSPEGSPIVAVESLHATLIEAMKSADDLGFEGRRALIAPVVAARFDLPGISRLVMGSHWRALSQADRTRLVDTLAEVTVATYAARFDGYAGEAFEVVEEREARRERRLVRSLLHRPDGEPVRLDYLVQPVGDEWRIVNVVADGVSELSLKRAEYGAIINADGFDRLIERMSEQVTSYAEEGATR